MSTAGHYPTDVSNVQWEVLQLLFPRLSGALVDRDGSPWTSGVSSTAFSMSIRRGDNSA